MAEVACAECGNKPVSDTYKGDSALRCPACDDILVRSFGESADAIASVSDPA